MYECLILGLCLGKGGGIRRLRVVLPNRTIELFLKINSNHEKKNSRSYPETNLKFSQLKLQTDRATEQPSLHRNRNKIQQQLILSAAQRNSSVFFVFHVRFSKLKTRTSSFHGNVVFNFYLFEKFIESEVCPRTYGCHFIFSFPWFLLQ